MIKNESEETNNDLHKMCNVYRLKLKKNILPNKELKKEIVYFLKLESEDFAMYLMLFFIKHNKYR